MMMTTTDDGNIMPDTQSELTIQESEVDSQQVSLRHQEDANRLLSLQLNELQKTLEDKENKLINANEVVLYVILSRELATFSHQKSVTVIYHFLSMR